MRNALIPRFGFGGDLWDEFDALFSSMFDAPTRRWRPSAESYVKDGKLELRLDLPGVQPEEVEITLDGSELVIRGERKTETERKDGYRETHHGSFERRFTVPEGIHAEKVVARYENGVLALSLPLPEHTKAKRITVAAQPAKVEKNAA